MAWHGKVRQGEARWGVAGEDKHCTVGPGEERMGRHDKVWWGRDGGTTWTGTAGAAEPGWARCGVDRQARIGVARL
jgi:hypothetical protein